MNFSKRYNYIKEKVIQFESMDNRLKTVLWNTFVFYIPKLENRDFILRRIYGMFFSLPLDKFPRLPKLPESFYKKKIFEEQYKKDVADYLEQRDQIISQMKTAYDKLQWFEVYDFIEHVTSEFKVEKIFDTYIISCNKYLEKENAGYRLLNDLITPITDCEELTEIEKTLNSPIDSVREHIKQSLALFSDRENPDYRNSIKEAISAVESLSRLISKNPNATLGDALKIIERSENVELHPALREAFSKLYGWTSDKKTGIRHGLMEMSDLSSEDARFMLITCSSFINYLFEKTVKADINITAGSS